MSFEPGAIVRMKTGTILMTVNSNIIPDGPDRGKVQCAYEMVDENGMPSGIHFANFMTGALENARCPIIVRETD